MSEQLSVHAAVDCTQRVGPRGQVADVTSPVLADSRQLECHPLPDAAATIARVAGEGAHGGLPSHLAVSL